MRGLKLGNKGLALEELSKVAMTLVFIGVAIAMSVYINQQMGTTSSKVSTVTNDTVAVTDGAWNLLIYPYVESISSVQNGTITIARGNWSFIKPNFFNASFDAAMLNTTNTWKITYVIYNDTFYNVLQNSTSGISALAQWLPIIMVVFAAALVIGVILVWLKPIGSFV